MLKNIKTLKKIIKTISPSGHEENLQKLIKKNYQHKNFKVNKDHIGNLYFNSVNFKKNQPKIMITGHCDEIGLMITYINNDGFLYFDFIGGVDVELIIGQRIKIISSKGDPIFGVIGKKPIHLMKNEEKNKIGALTDFFIDAGFTSNKEALKKVAVGDIGVIDHKLKLIQNNKIVAKAFDDKIGLFVIMEVMKKIAKNENSLNISFVSTVQEEIGLRGAKVGAYKVNPDIGIAVDVGFSSDIPGVDSKQVGQIGLGKGPIINIGPNIHKKLNKILIRTAKKHKIPYQTRGIPKGTGTDANVIQTNKKGVATILVSIPLRYMHSPVEMIDNQDIKHSIDLLYHFLLKIADLKL